MKFDDKASKLWYNSIIQNKVRFIMFKFNIGSAVNGVDKVISAAQAVQTLRYAGFHGIELVKAEASNTETTYVITAAGVWLDDHEGLVHTVSFVLHQDAIAYTLDGVGYLVGPKAEDWGGAFNPEYFID